MTKTNWISETLDNILRTELEKTKYLWVHDLIDEELLVNLMVETRI